MEEETISISEIIDILKSKWRIIAITTLIAAIVASIYSFFIISPMYSSSIKVYIGKDTIEKKDYSSGDVTLYQNLAKTYKELIPTEDLVQKAIEDNNLDVNAESVVSGLIVTNAEGSQVINISYVSKDLVFSKDVLDAIIKEFMRESKDLVPNGSAKVIETSKYPIYPSNFNSIRNIVIGLLGGLFVGASLVLFLQYMNNTFVTKEQIETSVKLPVIGIIPSR